MTGGDSANTGPGRLSDATASADARPAMALTEIREAGPGERPGLVEIWEAAVRATHRFLTEADIQNIRLQVEELLPSAEGLLVACLDGRPVGFMGLTPPEEEGGEAEIDMLFVHPGLHGQGTGTALIKFARNRYPRLKLSVNEQNPQARKFYEHRGFAVAGRSPVDSQGRDFPLLHMSTTVEV